MTRCRAPHTVRHRPRDRQSRHRPRPRSPVDSAGSWGTPPADTSKPVMRCGFTTTVAGTSAKWSAIRDEPHRGSTSTHRQRRSTSRGPAWRRCPRPPRACRLARDVAGELHFGHRLEPVARRQLGTRRGATSARLRRRDELDARIVDRGVLLGPRTAPRRAASRALRPLREELATEASAGSRVEGGDMVARAASVRVHAPIGGPQSDRVHSASG
jgi:hypothetical protein